MGEFALKKLFNFCFFFSLKLLVALYLTIGIVILLLVCIDLRIVSKKYTFAFLFYYYLLKNYFNQLIKKIELLYGINIDYSIKNKNPNKNK